MERKIDVVYEIEKSSSWRSEEGVDIKSNITSDELIYCRLSKSLIDVLKKESAMLDPDKLLLGFAEAQKRGIECKIEALNDLELRTKNIADTVQEKLVKAYEDSEKKYDELEEKFSEISDKFSKKVETTKDSLEKQMKYLTSVSEKLNAIDNYGLEKLTGTLKQLISLVEQDPEIVKLVLNNKKLSTN